MTMLVSQAMIASIDDLNRRAIELVVHDAQQSFDLGQRACALSRECSYNRGLFESLINISRAAYNLGSLDLALSAASEAQHYVEAVGDTLLQARLTETLGQIYSQAGDYPRALEYFLHYIALCEQVGERGRQALGIFRAGTIHSHMARYQEAIAHYGQSLAILQQVGDMHGQARVLNSYCVDYMRVGEYAKAIDCGQRSLELMRTCGDQYGTGVVHSSLGEAHLAAGQYDAALASLQQALDLMGDHDHEMIHTIDTLVTIATVYLRRGVLGEAIGLLHEVLERAQPLQMAPVLADCHRLLADAYEAQGDNGAALRHHRQYAEIRAAILNEDSIQKYQRLAVVYRTEQALAEAEHERQLRAEERRHFDAVSHMKDEFVRVASHDLKNPLSVIISGVDLLQTSHQLDTDGQEVLRLIQHATGRMHGLIGDMLDLLKLGTSHALLLANFAVRPLIEEVVDDYLLEALTKSLDLQSVLPPPEVIIDGDRAQLRRVLENLLSNAIKYTPKGGQIRLTVAVSGGQLLMSVQDTGLGIPAHDLPYIFDHFYRVKADSHHAIAGSGLGLAIVKAIVEQHGGTITVESVYQAGSTFHIALPLS